ncbi:MAG: gas vesicle protein [Pseudomonadota bacterium]
MPLNLRPADPDRPSPAISVATENAQFGAESLSAVLSELIDTGVVLQADLVLTLANVDLVYVGLQAVICGVDAMPARSALGPYCKATDHDA